MNCPYFFRLMTQQTAVVLAADLIISTWYAEHKLLIFGQLRPGGFKGGYATTYCGCLAAPIGVLCLVVYRVDLLRRFV